MGAVNSTDLPFFSSLVSSISSMQLSLKTFTGGNVVTVEVKSSAAIDMDEGKAGGDGCGSADSDIQKKSTFYRKGEMQIFVNTPAGKMIPVEVESSDTLHSVKSKIHYSEGVPSEDQTLVFGFDTLEDWHTLADCNIQNDSILHLLRSQIDDEKLIFVKTATATTIPFHVDPYDTIKSLMLEIQIKEGIHFDDQKLVFDGNLLSHWSKIQDCQIFWESTIYLVRCLRGGMVIFVKDFTGKIFPFAVKCSDTVVSLKAKIRDMESIPLHQPRLVLNRKKLEDGFALEEYSIKEESTLYSLPLLDDRMLIFVKTKDKIIPLGVEWLDDVYSLRAKIYDMEGTHLRHSKLLFNSKELEDDHALTDYNIEEKSTLHLVFP